MALYLAHSAEHYTPPSWSSGTVEEITEALSKHYSGEINLGDYWSVGDERVVSLNAMSATGVGESHVAQNVTFVIMNKGGKILSDGITECAFIVGQKNVLANGSTAENGYMNSTQSNTGSWSGCARRTWCNNVYREAIVAPGIKAWFKQFYNKTRDGDGATTISDSLDYFALPAANEVMGSNEEVYVNEGSQFSYYSTYANHKKYPGNSQNASAVYWYLRSPDSVGARFRSVRDTGAVYNSALANENYSIAPFGCI